MENNAALRIQKWYRLSLLRIQLQQIFHVFKQYKDKFVAHPNTETTEYEDAIGFTKSRLSGFNQTFARFMEHIYNVSAVFTKASPKGGFGGSDGHNNRRYYECKNRYNTMKQSQACREIARKLDFRVGDPIESKEFYLLILSDRNNTSRNIPLHRGNGLSGLLTHPGYDETHCRWLSGDCVYDHLFPTYGSTIKTFVLDLLALARP
jgi:hypothetical protein